MWLVAGPTNQTLSLSMWTQSQATGRENPPARWFRKCRIPTPLSPAAWTSCGSINAHTHFIQLLITQIILFVFVFFHRFLLLSHFFITLPTVLLSPSLILSPPFYPPLIFPLSPNSLPSAISLPFVFFYSFLLVPYSPLFLIFTPSSFLICSSFPILSQHPCSIRPSSSSCSFFFLSINPPSLYPPLHSPFLFIIPSQCIFILFLYLFL